MKTLIHLTLLFFTARFIPKKSSLGYNSDVGVSILVRHSDVYMCICSLTTLMYHLGKRLPVYIVDDGTLLKKDRILLEKCFDVVVEPVALRNSRAKKILGKYKYIQKFRNDSAAAINRYKIDAFFLHPFEKVLYVDSDCLFFQKPIKIINWLNSHTKTFIYIACSKKLQSIDNLRHQTTHIFRTLLYSSIKSSSDLMFNSGLLGLYSNDMLLLNRIDKAVKYIYKIGYDRNWQAEETIMGISLSTFNHYRLPPNKYVVTWSHDQYHKSKYFKPIFRHYAYETKDFFYRDAIYHCLKLCFGKV